LTINTSNQASTPSPSASALPSSRGLHTGAVIGIIAGAVIFVVILVAITIYLFLYKRRSHKTPTVATVPGLQCDFNRRPSELEASPRKTEPPVEYNIESQIPQIKAQYQNEEARQSGDSVSGGTTGSIEEDEVIVFHGRAGKNSV
jgi:hypothetical protein